MSDRTGAGHSRAGRSASPRACSRAGPPGGEGVSRMRSLGENQGEQSGAGGKYTLCPCTSDRGHLPYSQLRGGWESACAALPVSPKLRRSGSGFRGTEDPEARARHGPVCGCYNVYFKIATPSISRSARSERSLAPAEAWSLLASRETLANTLPPSRTALGGDGQLVPRGTPTPPHQHGLLPEGPVLTGPRTRFPGSRV